MNHTPWNSFHSAPSVVYLSIKAIEIISLFRSQIISHVQIGEPCLYGEGAQEGPLSIRLLLETRVFSHPLPFNKTGSIVYWLVRAGDNSLDSIDTGFTISSNHGVPNVTFG